MKVVDLCLRNAKIPFKDYFLDANVGVDEGKIVAICKTPHRLPADVEKNLRGMLLLPGLVDVHVHFRDPGLVWKEDFLTGSRAAAAGGVTTVCDMPNCVPPTSSLKRFRKKIKIGEKKSLVDFALHAALPDKVKEGEKLIKAGAASFKIFTYLQKDVVISKFLMINPLISAHAEDPRVLSKFNPRSGDIREFIRCRPKLAETSEISRLLNLILDRRLHICHISAGESVNLISRAKRKGKRVTCEVTPHHVLLSLKHLKKLGPIAQTLPPLRTSRDRLAVLKALRDGTIDIIASDHAPHSPDEKERGWTNIWESPPGIAGIETSLPLIFTLGQKGGLQLQRLIEAMCTLPAQIFGLRNELGVPKGVLRVGADADLVALDPKKKWKIRGKNLHGKTKFTPFEGYQVKGKPVLTIVRGGVVFEDGEVVGKPGHGRFIPCST